MSTELNKKIIKATKWSTAAELSAKLVAPISTMVLARVLTPEAYGVLVTATMVISFAEIFTDAGFQKYLIQHEFNNKESLFRATNVAFIANLSLSMGIWILISIFSEPIAALVGNKGYGLVIAISSICIPLAAFSSIQMAIYKRHFDFKTLFIVRMVGVAIPIIVTIPLAILIRSYWALIGGMIALNLSNAIILTIKSEWKPKMWFSWTEFHKMFSFTSWTMIEAVSLWATSYVDIFIIGKMMNDYYLGLYRTSMSTVGQFVTVITAAVIPVLFSTISRLQNNPIEFNRIFLKFQKILSILIIPLGTLIYIYRNLITEFLLGPQWQEAAFFIGLWALTSGVTIVLANITGEVYRAKGKPILSVIVQLSHIVFIIPTVLLAIPHGFHTLCEWRSIIRLELVISNFIALYHIVKITPIEQIKNIFPALLGGTIIIIISSFFPISHNYFIEFLQLLLSATIYFVLLLLFPKERQIIYNLKNLINRQ